MGEAHFAWLHPQAATDECGHRGRMMRSTERTPARNRAIGEFARKRLHHRDFEGLTRIERRKDAGQALRQHRLAGARWTKHQHVVSACRSDFERTLGRLLTLYILEVG